MSGQIQNHEKMAVLRTQRAIDAVRRGEAVRIADAGGLTFTAYEAGHNAAVSSILQPASAHALDTQISRKAPHTPAEHAALFLLAASGMLPAAALLPASEHATEVTLYDIEHYKQFSPRLLHRLPEARLPVKGVENARVIGFREQFSGDVHLALLIGSPETGVAPLTRVHSSCLTGDVLESLRCDCGAQLHAAVRRIAEDGNGLILYIQQEGRGIGLAGKLRAYGLQDEGLDTVDANIVLGYGADERDFRIAATMLRTLGIPAIRLLTNNPAKVAALSAEGIHITERIALHAGQSTHNHTYLSTKRDKMGHL